MSVEEDTFTASGLVIRGATHGRHSDRAVYVCSSLEVGGEWLPKVRAHVFVSGMVQGVFFRSETEDKATRQDVAGWVRNLPDGRVEAVFEGEKENVDRLVEFCRRGPPGARVTRVDVSWEGYKGEFRGFRVRYGY